MGTRDKATEISINLKLLMILCQPVYSKRHYSQSFLHRERLAQNFQLGKRYELLDESEENYIHEKLSVSLGKHS